MDIQEALEQFKLENPDLIEQIEIARKAIEVYERCYWQPVLTITTTSTSLKAVTCPKCNGSGHLDQSFNFPTSTAGSISWAMFCPACSGRGVIYR